jgi:P27 family predicted phage terminase small subunit
MSRPPADPQFLHLVGRKPRPSRAVKEPPEEHAASKPKCPAHFSDAEKKAFKRWCKLLSRRSTLTEVDGPILELLVILHSQLLKCREEISEHGAFEKDVDGCTIESAPSKLLTKLCAQLRMLQAQVGATPTTRARAAKTQPSEKDRPPVPGSLADLLQQRAALNEEQDAEPEEVTDAETEFNELLDDENLGGMPN